MALFLCLASVNHGLITKHYKALPRSALPQDVHPAKTIRELNNLNGWFHSLTLRDPLFLQCELPWLKRELAERGYKLAENYDNNWQGHYIGEMLVKPETIWGLVTDMKENSATKWFVPDEGQSNSITWLEQNEINILTETEVTPHIAALGYMLTQPGDNAGIAVGALRIRSLHDPSTSDITDMQQSVARDQSIADDLKRKLIWAPRQAIRVEDDGVESGPIITVRTGDGEYTVRKRDGVLWYSGCEVSLDGNVVASAPAAAAALIAEPIDAAAPSEGPSAAAPPQGPFVAAPSQANFATAENEPSFAFKVGQRVVIRDSAVTEEHLKVIRSDSSESWIQVPYRNLKNMQQVQKNLNGDVLGIIVGCDSNVEWMPEGNVYIIKPLLNAPEDKSLMGFEIAAMELASSADLTTQERFLSVLIDVVSSSVPVLGYTRDPNKSKI